ncbi:MAG: hypothetical protein WD894_22715 [Pirellulales bacterium]
MYRWRKLTDQQRQELLDVRQREGRPWHSPAHYTSDTELYMITAACFEHRPIIGQSTARMSSFEQDLLNASRELARDIFAWNVLPNHYHLLVRASDVKALLKRLGKVHGRTSYFWNGEDHQRGRKVWFNAVETAMKSERHFWASMNYVLNNAVHHGYVQRWQDWPFSNAAEYLAEVGRDVAQRRWLKYPVLDYGKDWDPPDL